MNTSKRTDRYRLLHTSPVGLGFSPEDVVPTPAASRGPSAMTLIEMLVAVAVGSLVLMVVMMVFMYSSRAFAAVTNYVSMDGDSRNALDHLTQEIRQAGNLAAFSPTKLEFGWHAQTNSFLVFNWDSTSGQLTEWNTSTTTTNVLLTGCDQLSFSLYDASFAPTTNLSAGKVIGVAWECSRTVLGVKNTTENMQQALVVIRNKPL